MPPTSSFLQYTPMNYDQAGKSPSLSKRQIEVLSGLSAGFSTTILTHPLDVIKIRLQLLSETSKTRFFALRNVIARVHESAAIEYKKSNGRFRLPYVVRQYYRGLTPNLVGNISAWSLYFTLYAEFKGMIKTSNATVNYFALSSLAGISTSLLTNPIWVLKTRILGTSRTETNAYKSIWDGIKQIYANEGILSFWKGTIPSLFLVFQGSLQFTFYDHLKNWFQTGDERKLSTQQYIYSLALSKILSMSVMYPSQVVKSRLQNYNLTGEPRNIQSVCKNIWKNEGQWRGFYKGISANIFRVLPATCITFVVYESVKNNLA